MFLSSFSNVQFYLTLFYVEPYLVSRRETLVQEKNGGQFQKTLPPVPHALPIAIPHSNPTARLRPNHLRKHSRRLSLGHPSPSKLQLRALMLMQR
ncbi:hypothetical protein BDR03DRAFT_954382 [Suillus americanus]|nr:hypothetical protein BDR03DRAFT_954382 [Suillus americanus]